MATGSMEKGRKFMSLDLWLASTQCEACHHQECSESLNYTYNVADMWLEILKIAEKESKSYFFKSTDKMINIDGSTGNQSVIPLNYALSVLSGLPQKFIAMNPENGWGSYNGLMDYIVNLLLLAHKHPTWIWHSSR